MVFCTLEIDHAGVNREAVLGGTGDLAAEGPGAGDLFSRGIVDDFAEAAATAARGTVGTIAASAGSARTGKLDRDGMTGQGLRRSVCVDELFFNEDGTVKPLTQTKEGITEPVK